MKKDKNDIKSSLQSWLIALICCIVVIGATVCGIVFGLVPMNVALADFSTGVVYTPVDSFVWDNAPLISNSDTTIIGSFTLPNQGTLPIYMVEVGCNGYDVFVYIGNMYNIGGYYVELSYALNQSSTAFEFVNCRYMQMGTHIADYNYSQLQIQLTTLSDLSGDDLRLFELVFGAYSPPVVDDTPDVLLSDIKTIHFNYSGLQFTQQNANRTFTLYGYKVSNAGDYTNQYGNCFVSVKYITYGEEPITISINQVMLNRLNDGYYLVLTCPDSIERVQVAFQGYTDWFTIEYDVYDNVGLFITNYENIRAIENEGRRIGFSTGYSEGYVAGTTEKNNLLSVMWSTFEMPFTLLFGHYDDDQYSQTYGQYVGGLFNFTILGLDVRAFVLGLMSLIILVGISRFILGAFHIGG